jgi:vacuolar-type H+-ATPase subunit H
MTNSEINFEEVIKGNKRVDIVDKLEELRTQLNSNSLKGRLNKKDLIKSIDEIIDSVPVEMRTARWIVREQESFINQAKNESKNLINEAKVESEKLIANSYVLQEAVIEANALIKQAEVETQAYRASIEDTVDQKIEDIQLKIQQISNFLEVEKNKLREPRNIDKPQEQ